MTTLMKASHEWSSRPADERFKSLQDLHDHCQYQRSTAQEGTRALSTVSALATDGAVKLVGPLGNPATLTNWSFSQLARIAEAPAGYLASIPAPLAAECVNHGLSTADPRDLQILASVNGDTTIRAITSEKYTRIWNTDVTRRLLRLAENGPWQPAPAAFDGSRGLYAGDRDLFAFLVDSDRRIFEKAPGGGLSRGFFVWNSEVGAASFGLMTFLYEYVCGNHLVWGASGVREIRMRHVGDADARADRELLATLRAYAEDSTSDDEAKIQQAMTVSLGKDKNEVLDKLFGLRVPALTRSALASGYAIAEKHAEWYGSPRNVWGMVNGLTEVARDLPNASDRVALERAAGRVMDLAF